MTAKETKSKGAAKAAPDNEKSGRVPFLISDEEFERCAKGQKVWLEDIACRVERGESLTRIDRQVIAGALRQSAKSIPDKQPRPKGQPPRIDAGAVALHYAWLVHAGDMAKSDAISRLAELNEVSIEAIKKAVGKHGEAARRIVEWGKT